LDLRYHVRLHLNRHAWLHLNDLDVSQESGSIHAVRIDSVKRQYAGGRSRDEGRCHVTRKCRRSRQEFPEIDGSNRDVEIDDESFPAAVIIRWKADIRARGGHKGNLVGIADSQTRKVLTYDWRAVLVRLFLDN